MEIRRWKDQVNAFKELVGKKGKWVSVTRGIFFFNIIEEYILNNHRIKKVKREVESAEELKVIYG